MHAHPALPLRPFISCCCFPNNSYTYTTASPLGSTTAKSALCSPAALQGPASFSHLPLHSSQHLPLHYSQHLPLHDSRHLPWHNSQHLPLHYSRHLPLHYSQRLYSEAVDLHDSALMVRSLFAAALLHDTASSSQIQRVHRPHAGLTLRGLTLLTPAGGRHLCHNLNLTLQAGNSLLIVGPSGCGKSSLLRAIAGLLTDLSLLSCSAHVTAAVAVATASVVVVIAPFSCHSAVLSSHSRWVCTSDEHTQEDMPRSDHDHRTRAASSS